MIPNAAGESSVTSLLAQDQIVWRKYVPVWIEKWLLALWQRGILKAHAYR
jgi:hypothetical protein